MILYELLKSENYAVYSELSISNYVRQLNFLKSLVSAALETQTVFLSQTVIKALNYHALACLHDYAGQYRPHRVDVMGTSGRVEYSPPQHFQVATLMDDFVNRVNRLWDSTDAFELAAYVLWRINHIHPFVNGNGRTARAACYFVLCLKAGAWLGGSPILPDLLKSDPRYVPALKEADNENLQPLTALIAELLYRQLQSA